MKYTNEKFAAAIIFAIFSLAFILFMTGCRVITFSQTSPNGVKTSVTVWQAFTSTDAYKAVLEPSRASVEASKSGIDGKALGTAAGTAGNIILNKP